MQNSRESDSSERTGRTSDAGGSGPGRAGSSQMTEESPNAAAAQTDAPERTDPAELARAEDRYKRALADLDNYRKRSEREIQRRVEEATESVIRDWLEAIDSVERALSMGAEGPYAAGMQAMLDQMNGILARQGVRRIGAQGDPFDPEQHEAVAVRVAPDVPDRTILELARSGFALGDRVIRPAQVVVARTPEHAS